MSRAVWAGALALATVLPTFVAVFARSPFPPGADPGHLLALSRAFTDAHPPEGELLYAPGVPALCALLRGMVGDEPAPLLGGLKALGLLTFVAQALGLALLGAALAGTDGAAWAFLLALLNPLAHHQLLWGGYPQFLAVGLGAAGLGLLWRALDGDAPRRVVAGAGLLLGGCVLVHTYSAVFFLPAAALAVLARGRRSLARGLAAGGITVLAALPAIPAYLRIARAVRETPAPGVPAALGAEALAHRGLLATSLALVAFAFVAARPRGPRGLALALAGGACVLALATPLALVDRLFGFLAHGLVLAAATALAARVTLREAGSRPSPVLAATLGFLLAAHQAAALSDVWAEQPRFAPLGEPTLAVLAQLRRERPGRVLAVSTWGNADGWWIEGLGGRPTLIADDLKWYVLAEEVERAMLARGLALGGALYDGGGLALVDDSSEQAGSYAVLVAQDAGHHPLLEIRGWPMWVDRPPPPVPAPAVAPLGQEAFTVEVPRAHDTLRRAARGEAGGLRLRWTFEPEREGGSWDVEVVAAVPEGLEVEKASFAAGRLSWTLRDTEHGCRHTLEAEADGAALLDASGRTLRLRGATPLALRLHAPGATLGPWRASAQDALLQRSGVTHVCTRLEGYAARFRRDPRYELVLEAPPAALFRVRGPSPAASP